MSFVYSNSGRSFRSVGPDYVPGVGEVIFDDYATDEDLATAFADFNSQALMDAKSTRIDGLRDDCAVAITGGYQSSALGSIHTYPSDDKSQFNMNTSVLASLLPDLPGDWTTPFWCADQNMVWAFASHSATQIRQAGSDGKIAVVTAQTKLATLSAQVMSAGSIDAVNAIVW